MLRDVGFEDLDPLIEAAIPKNIRLDRQLNLPEAKSESEALAELRGFRKRTKCSARSSAPVIPIASRRRSFSETFWKIPAGTPPTRPIKLSAQGRLEALLNFQTMIIDLTKLDVANASFSMKPPPPPKQWRFVMRSSPIGKYFLSPNNCHPQTIGVVRTRAKPLGIDVKIDNFQFKSDISPFLALLSSIPPTDGAIYNYSRICWASARGRRAGRVAADIFGSDTIETAGGIRRRCRDRQYAAFWRALRVWRATCGILCYARGI